MSVVALRARDNERGDYLITTTPATNEAAAASAAEQMFPRLVNGDGWSPQFILFSGGAGQAAKGALRFFTTAGAPLPLPVN
jgi:hypothetical protein